MNTKRMIGLVVGIGVVVGAILLALGFNAAPTAKGNQPGAIGMGDMQRFEAQHLSVVPAVSAAQPGMGDVKSYDALKLNAAAKQPGMGDVKSYDAVKLNATAPAVSAAQPGMGDLKSYEGVKISAAARQPGMGDLQRYEAGQR